MTNILFCYKLTFNETLTRIPHIILKKIYKIIGKVEKYMCSICGVVDFANKENAFLPDGMGECMKHRGPDDTGIFFAPGAALHHNRLSVMDTENGAQPMKASFGGKTAVIVYNGEIYNTDELKTELEKFGIEFQTSCDTEVVLYAYLVWGEDCPSHLNGIFAFCVYDDDKVFFCRDRFGIKPFFYSVLNTTFVFGSEIKSLLKHPKIEPILDKTGLWQLLFMSPASIGGSGIFRDILELKPGYCGTFDKEGIHLKRYWKLKAHEFGESRDDAVEHTKYLLKDAIRRQLKSDVPLCTFLSGGLDSSVITAVSSEYMHEHNRTLSTYSFEYEGNKENFKSTLFQPQGDDEYAVYLADFLKTDHTVLTAPTEEVAKCLIDATDARDFPGQADIDSSLLYFCRLVKMRHTVALSGECADEIFGGYPWFYRPEMLYRDFFPWIHEPMARASLFDDDIVRSADGMEFMREVYKKSLNDCDMLDSDSETMKHSRVATRLSVDYFMTSLLERKDRCSMASGLEVRVPFADHRILEYVYNVPWEIKFEDNVEKALLRNAMAEYLPDKILHRKKSPYPKTHNPAYEKAVLNMLKERIEKGGILSRILKCDTLKSYLEHDNTTWFGQLMGKPQLIAWLVQFDYFFEKYNVILV